MSETENVWIITKKQGNILGSVPELLQGTQTGSIVIRVSV